MSAHRGPFLRTRSLALLLPLLTGLVLTSAPAVAAPVATEPPSRTASSLETAADESALVPAEVTLTGSSDDAGVVRLEIQVSAAGASVTGGTVALSDDGVLVEPALAVTDGVATYTASDIRAGGHEYTAVYTGTDGVAPAEGRLILSVQAAATPVLEVTANSPAVGVARIAVAVLVKDEPSGEGPVEVREAGSVVARGTVSDGSALIEVAGQQAGRHTYTVVYTDARTGQDASKPVDVDVLAKAASSVAITSSSPAVGKLVLTARVFAAGAPVRGGTARVKEGTRTVSKKMKVVGGAAVWRASGLRSGRHTYTIRFSGTATVKAASTTRVATVKAKAKPKLSLTATSAAPKKVRVTIRVKATGQTRLGGSVRIKEGSRTRKAKIAVKAGKASWSATGVRPGKHTYTVAYAGTSQVKAGSARVRVTVKKPVVVKEYKNCTELNKVFRHGVGRPGAVDRVSGNTEPVTGFLRHTKLYSKNTKSDADKDGIACEKL